MIEIGINQERCKGCDLCLNLCPKKVFEESDEIGKQGFKLRKPINFEKCSKCGLCQYFCPEGAIVLDGKFLISDSWEKAQKLKEIAINQNVSRGGWKIIKTHFPGNHFISGNIACVWGAIDAGCKMFAGYPITPANEQSFEMERLMPKTGGIFIQMENEDSSLAVLCGASLSGAKSMTATSGPGFSRMSENLSFALINELPMVIVNVQRTGPSTGRPTGTGSGEIREARWSSHGGTEHIVLYPSTIQEIYNFTVKAFNLSEEFRVPIILMLEASNAHLQENVEIPEEINVFDRIYFPGNPIFGSNKNSLVSSMPKYGDGEILKVSGLTHNRWGVPCPDDAQVHEEMVEYQRRKIVYRANYLTDIDEYLLKDAEIMIVACGHTARSVKWAIDRARGKGIKVGMFKLNILYPFPEEKIEKWSKQVKCVLVPEINQGQLFYIVRESSCSPVISLPQPDGENINPRRILKFLERDLTKYYRQSLPMCFPTFYNPLEWQKEREEKEEEAFSPDTIFCPGCGLGILRNCLLEAIDEANIDFKKIVAVSGIGCTSRLPNYLPFDSANTTHGYPMPFATGVKLVNPDSQVIVISGDGDSFSIGAGQMLHGIKRDMPMVVICVNNSNFGMTGGQVAPTTPLGAKTSTTPFGNRNKPFDLIGLALASNAKFVARCLISKPVMLKKVLKQAMDADVLAFIEVISPCLTYYGKRNKLGSPSQTYKRLDEAYISKAKAKKSSYEEMRQKFETGFPFRKNSAEIVDQELLQLIYGKFYSLTEYMSFVPKKDKKESFSGEEK